MLDIKRAITGEARIANTFIIAIVIVCHGGNIMSILSRLTGDDYYDFMTETLGGYVLELETNDEGINVISYHKLRAGDNS